MAGKHGQKLTGPVESKTKIIGLDQFSAFAQLMNDPESPAKTEHFILIQLKRG